MPANTFGEMFRITTFGESHGKGVGVVVDGCPAGLELTEQDIQKELDRRRPGQSKITTPRNEPDKVEILSGVFEGKTTGAPICLMVFNTDQKSQDYQKLKDLYRPGHADFTFDQKFGHRDPRGGGRTSARIMIGRVAAGAIAKKFLKEKLNIEFLAYTESVGKIKIPDLNNYSNFKLPTQRLLLKAISFDYLEEIFEEFSGEINNFTYISQTNIVDTAKYISDSINQNEEGKGLKLVILDKETQEFLGVCGIHKTDTKTPEFGIWLKKSAHNQRFGKEAITNLFIWAEKNLNFDYLKYEVDKKNIASKKIPESLGGKIIKEFIKETPDKRKLEIIEYHIFTQRMQDLIELKEILKSLDQK
jgi:RimJ/RimL family protein N-acetyltransferase